MSLRNKKSPHPEELKDNGDFATTGGFRVYELLYGLQGRVSRTEAAVAFLASSQVAILGRVFGAW